MEGSFPLLYRQRLIPKECVALKDDRIIYLDQKIIVTSWNTLKPKLAFDHGNSCYFLEDCYKVSNFLLPDGSLLYWYCDIIDYTYDTDKNSYTFRDLLADVIVYPDGFVKVMDLDEFEEALEAELLTGSDVKLALRALSKLLNLIYEGRFSELTKEITGRVS